MREIFAASTPPTAQVAAPTFNLAPGTYSTPQIVTISDINPGASIYVTVDGSTSVTAANGYSFPITVAGPEILKAVATKPGYLPSASASASYVVDTYEPVISTIAGTGFETVLDGLSGTGVNGPAIDAAFGNPNGVAIDKAGDIYVSDSYNNLIWKISAADGTASIVAGTGLGNTEGNVTFSLPSGVPATSVPLNGPQGIVLDSASNLYIADTGDLAIRVVISATGLIYTAAGGGNLGAANNGDGGWAGSAWIESPYSVALDSADNLYIADYGKGCLFHRQSSRCPCLFATGRALQCW